MSYKRTTIKKAIDDIDHKKIYLPALQRKFVWRKHQIELLFDSLMRNYPFGTFLFWRLQREKADHYVFYEFLTEYDQRSPYNRRKTGAFTHPDIIGVLDGQQRLSSMYIGLMGTHTEKAPYKWETNPDAYEKMCLYINLLSLPYIVDAEDKLVTLEEQNFEFRFLTTNEALYSISRKSRSEDGVNSGEEPMFWMKAGQVLSWDAEPEFDRIIDNCHAQCQSEEQKTAFTQQRRQVRRGLETLHKRIHTDELINYFEVAKDDLEDILKIFVRVNSGGTILSKTDLLFSTIVATWSDGRERIEDLLKSINSKGDGFNFANEYLMRCCLILTDGPVVYNVKSFKAENVQRIRDEWPRIAEAVARTVGLLVEFGFSGNVLSSQNATILIAYYLYKGGSLAKESKLGLRKYLVHALLNGIYGSAQDQVISSLRNAIRADGATSMSCFSFEDILKVELPQQKSLSVTESDIERFLQYKKGTASFFVLALLYPHLRYSDVMFHQDHIHPAAGFTEQAFRDWGIPEEQWAEWMDCRDAVPNLQLMNDRQNISKNATPFKQWFYQMGQTEQATFSSDNYIPVGVNLDFLDFTTFYKRRKDVLREELKKVLALTNERPTPEVPEWNRIDEEIVEKDLT